MDIKYITPDNEIFLINNYFEKGLADMLYKDLKESSSINGTKKHNKTIHFEALENTWLRCPSIEEKRMFPMSTPIINIVTEINNELNIAKIINYHSGIAYIESHSDKILDLDPNYPIYLVRFGATRTCILTNKVTGEEIKVPMSHGSLLSISYKANILYRHAVNPEPEVTEESLSVVLRKSVTKKYKNYVYGMNSPFATEKQLIDYLETDVDLFWNKKIYNTNLMKCYESDNMTTNGWTIIHEAIRNNSIWA